MYLWSEKKLFIKMLDWVWDALSRAPYGCSFTIRTSNDPLSWHTVQWNMFLLNDEVMIGWKEIQQNESKKIPLEHEWMYKRHQHMAHHQFPLHFDVRVFKKSVVRWQYINKSMVMTRLWFCSAVSWMNCVWF